MTAGAAGSSSAAGNDGDFGQVRVGTSARQVFTVSNPSQQPSGGLAIAVFHDFKLVPASTDMECQPGITSLAGEQSCSITVELTPSSSGEHDGALTVSSALAGAVHMPLTGHGLEPARLSVVSEQLDLGRVPTETPVTQIVRVTQRRRRGGQRFADRAGGPGGQQRARLQQHEHVPDRAGRGRHVRGERAVLADRGSGVWRCCGWKARRPSRACYCWGWPFRAATCSLSPVGGSGDLGDVAIGQPRTRQFTLSNGGGTPSGRLTINATNNLFTVDLGDCQAEGLDPGASCTLSIRLAPTTSAQIDLQSEPRLHRRPALRPVRQ